MEHLLNNFVYQGLLSNDSHLGSGTEKVKFFDEEVSPFVGFEEGYEKGFDDLADMLPHGRKILFASPHSITQPNGWQLIQEIKGLQFVFDSANNAQSPSSTPIPLQKKDVEQMVQLAALTKPGPFSSRTIEFGHYHGFFEEQQLVAMTGQRLHVQNFTEVSAVCTHPGHLGKGYAFTLVQHQVNLIRDSDQIPFLHVREDNQRAIAIYDRLGFKIRGAMNFYFMKRK